jgi:hypothetical protein
MEDLLTMCEGSVCYFFNLARTLNSPALGVNWRTKYGDVVNELAKLDSSGNFVVLRSHWGRKPRWSVPDPGLDIETNCQVLYAVFMSKPMRYIVGLVRTQKSDYPIAICRRSSGAI